jgi:galactofuranose transport system ATP-binding protein
MEGSSLSLSPLLVMRGIEKRFNGVPALSGASLEVGRGEVHALIGQNGAGKSTMIKILTGYYTKDAGEILFNGAPFHADSPKNAQAGGISTIYQEINLIPYRSVAENIGLGHAPRRFGFLDWQRMHREAEELLARFKVEIDVCQPLSAYTTAIQQMVAIARAVSFEAKLVIMDEPTSSLDDHEVAVLFDVVRQLKASGVAVIFVSHRLEELYVVCDRVTVMRDGRTVLNGALAGFTKLDLVTTMIGRRLKSAGDEQTAFRESAHAEQRTSSRLLEVRNLSAGRKVTDASLQLSAGEIVGLAGLLGSGRTELARAVFGADRPDNGEMEYDGTAFAPATPAAAIGVGIGFCSEDRKVDGIVPDMSVRENLTLALLPYLARAGVVDREKQVEVVDRFIQRLAIKCSSPDQPIRELSGGNQQKVLLARWLCMNPRLLILDEPTRGIDVGAKAEIQSLIGQLAAEGLGVLMISSEMEEILEGSDRVFVLREGKTVANLKREEISEETIMAAMADGTAALHQADSSVRASSSPTVPISKRTSGSSSLPLTRDGQTAPAAVPVKGDDQLVPPPIIEEEGPVPARADERELAPSDHIPKVGKVRTRPAAWPWLDQLRRRGTLVALLALILFNLFFTPHFVSWQTLNVNLTQVCTIVMVAVGMTFVIGTAGIDLSVGSLMAISGALAPIIFLGKWVPVPLGIGVALAFVVPVMVTSLFGWFNGWLITRFRIQPIVGTLILFIAGRGVAQVLTNGNLQPFSVPSFQFIGLGRPFGIPFQAFLMALLVICAAWVLRQTVFGHQVLAIGGNEEAARLCGIPVNRVKRSVYLISGFCAGIAGLIVIAINSSSDANLVGLGMELDAIAAVAVGGTRLTGGYATVIGTLLGALIIQLVRYTLLANGVPDSVAHVVKGGIIVASVWIQQRAQRA